MSQQTMSASDLQGSGKALIAVACLFLGLLLIVGAITTRGFTRVELVHVVFKKQGDLKDVVGYTNAIQIARKSGGRVPIHYDLPIAGERAVRFTIIKPMKAMGPGVVRANVHIPYYPGDRLDCMFGCTLTPSPNYPVTKR